MIEHCADHELQRCSLSFAACALSQRRRYPDELIRLRIGYPYRNHRCQLEVLRKPLGIHLGEC